ncbi:hypothetical protein Tco_0484394 [Tanacetum coccineum]
MGTYLQYAALTTRSLQLLLDFILIFILCLQTLSGASDMSIDLSGENEADGPKPPSNETPTPLNQTPTPSNEITEVKKMSPDSKG